MKLKAVLAGSLLLALTANPASANAVCLYPKTAKSGYKVPIEAEVRTAEAIVIGRVLSEQPLHEDADDPDGVTASNVTIKVLSILKGSPPRLVVVRNENTSSRYPMSAGEEHILFISSTDQGMRIDGCGNSEGMPHGQQVAKEVREQLRASKQ